MATDSVERWLGYRHHRTDTAHDDGQDFAEATLTLLLGFIQDARSTADIIEGTNDV
jgi:hypothetical protein